MQVEMALVCVKKSKESDIANASGKGRDKLEKGQAPKHEGLVGHNEGHGF